MAVERAQTLFGEDMWPYGIEANRCTLEAFTQFCFEQGVTDRRVPLSELFPPQLTKTIRPSYHRRVAQRLTSVPIGIILVQCLFTPAYRLYKASLNGQDSKERD